MAINGDGFFSVQAATGSVDNTPVFSGVTDYTRRGDFQVNANGNLVNGAGYYLMGVAVDPKTGNPLGNVPASSPVPEQFHSGAGHQRDSVRREPSDHARDRGKRHRRRRHDYGRWRPKPRRFQPTIPWCWERRRRLSLTTQQYTGAAALNQAGNAGSDHRRDTAVRNSREPTR